MHTVPWKSHPGWGQQVVPQALFTAFCPGMHRPQIFTGSALKFPRTTEPRALRETILAMTLHPVSLNCYFLLALTFYLLHFILLPEKIWKKFLFNIWKGRFTIKGERKVNDGSTGTSRQKEWQKFISEVNKLNLMNTCQSSRSFQLLSLTNS